MNVIDGFQLAHQYSFESPLYNLWLISLLAQFSKLAVLATLLLMRFVSLQ